MLVKYFVFGIPGSGKSTVAQHMVDHVNLVNDWSATRISDYGILHKWFLEDKDHRDFEPVNFGGFHVKDISTDNKALKAVEEEIDSLQSLPVKENQLIVVELARSDYVSALGKFREETLENSCFLYLDTNIEVCMARIIERIKHPQPRSLDDHYLSPRTLETYVNHVPFLVNTLNRVYGIEVEVISNGGALVDAFNQVDILIDDVMDTVRKQKPGSLKWKKSTTAEFAAV